MQPKPFPPLSQDIIQAAEAAFGKRNLYVMVGSAVNTLFTGIDLSYLYPQEGMPKELPYLLSLVTIFQFKEGIADRQAAEATRVRVDWKYALHLPLTHPGLHAITLCDFRRRLFMNEEGKTRFQRLLVRLQQACYLPEGPLPSADADLILQSVCTRSRLETVASAMQAAVEALVVSWHEWLRGIVPPHWYQRYSRDLSTLQVPDEPQSQVELAESIGQDGLYLLNAIAQANSTALAELAEIQTLKQTWELQFELQAGRCKWRASDCASCMQKLA